MSMDLVQEAIGHTPIEVLPPEDYILIHPVVPDRQQKADIVIARMGGHELPSMGVICAMGWKVNFGEVLDRLREIQAEGVADVADEFVDQAMYQVGDVILINKFSGMDVPGTNMVLIAKADVLGKIRNFPVRLQLPEDVAEKVREATRGRAAEEERSALVLPHGS